jgi:hypothetical protein
MRVDKLAPWPADATKRTMHDHLATVFPQQVKKGKTIPWRLRDAYGLFQQMARNSAKCHYPGLVDAYCPFPHGDGSLYSYAAPVHRVYQFIRAAVLKVVPLELFGHKGNRDTFLSSLDKWLMMKRSERLPLHDMLHGFKAFSML